MSNYQPNNQILKNYADILINFALGGGKGIKKGDVVRLNVPEVAKPLLFQLYQTVLKAGGHPLINYLPNDDKNFTFSKTYYQLASQDQLNFFPAKLSRGIVNQIDHSLSIIADLDKQALKAIDPVKIMTRNKVSKPLMDWYNAKENKGKFTWVIAMYGTQQMAKEAKLSLEAYWQQIIKGCYLSHPDPISKWRQTASQITHIVKVLNSLAIKTLHIKGQAIDLKINLGEKRLWKGGSGRNIPSFEIFTSPDWRGTQGFISFNQPLYRYGNIIKDIKLEFKKGLVTKFLASQNQAVLAQMIKTRNANKIGEFSLTDSRFSQIDKFMAETLYDENVGGPQGNTHIALGMAYKDCYDGNPDKLTKKQWRDLGFNDSAIHTDIVSTTQRTVTATLASGDEKLVYKNGQFTL